LSKTTNEIENIAVKVSSAAERKIRQGHPWVFEDSITKQNKDEKAGDLAIIYGKKKNKVLAIGLFDPLAIIRIRIIHFGGPEKIDQAFFAEKLQLAFTRREKIMQSETNAFRWVFGENDGFPGLILDNYDRHLVIKLYSRIL
jgi:23S rRNA (cytosine1962-C5)-methyltransferase